jgi:O-antigen ligase
MWKFSVNLADAHPIEGGGFDVFYVPIVAQRYMPPGFNARAPHSIYFEVLAEHGYVGLYLFLAMLLTGWFSAATNRKRYKEYEETHWLSELNNACQLAIVAYVVGGLTVNIATFDIIYHVLAIIVMSYVVGEQILAGDLTEKGTGRKLDANAKKAKWTPGAAAAPQKAR